MHSSSPRSAPSELAQGLSHPIGSNRESPPSDGNSATELNTSRMERTRKTHLPSPPPQSMPELIQPSSTTRGGATLVLIATFGLAFKGIWARLAYEEGLGVSGVLFYRSALSVPLILVSTWLLLRRETKNSEVQNPLSFRDYLPGVLLGAMFSVGMFTDFEAIAQLGASVSRVILFGFPLVVMTLTAAKTRKLPPRYQLIGFFAAWLGLVCIAERGKSTPVSFGTFGGAPLFWGLASMVIYALYVWASGNLSHKLGSVRLTSVSNLSTAAVVISAVLFFSGATPPQATQEAIAWVSVMVVVSTVVPYFLMMEGIRRLGSSRASLLAMTGPVVTVVAGWLVLGESLSLVQLIGTGLVLVGVGLGKG